MPVSTGASRATEAQTPDTARELLNGVLENSSEAIVVVDDVGTIAYATRGVALLLGYEPSSVLGGSVFDFVHADDLEVAADLFVRRLGYPGSDQGKEVRIRHSSGEWLTCLVTAALIDGSPLGAAALTLTAADDAAHWRELALRRELAVGELTYRLSVDLLSAADTRSVLSRLTESLAEIGLITGAEIVAVYLERPDRGSVELFADWHADVTYGASNLSADNEFARRLLDTPLVINSLDSTEHPDLHREFAHLGAKAVLSAPLSTAHRRGALALYRTQPGLAWWQSDVVLASNVAMVTGRALDGAWSNRLLLHTYHDGPVAIAVHSWDGSGIECNERFLDLFHLTRDQVLGTPMADLVHPDHLAGVQADIRRLHAGGAGRVVSTFEATRADGSSIWLRSTSVRLQVPGTPDSYVLSALEDVTESEFRRRRLEFAATHDTLTGAANRTAMYATIDDMAAQHGELPSVLFIDLDRFKAINDGYGHPAGNAVLQEIAARLAAQVGRADVVARIGGDEFVLVVPRLDEERAGALARSVLDALAAPIRWQGRTITQHASIGVVLGSTCDDETELLAQADHALYTAKELGRNTYVVFDESMRAEVAGRAELERDLRRAIEHDELEVYFQPEFSVCDRSIIGAEALLRWHHPYRGLIAAGSFIEIAEKSDLIDSIGRIALLTATERFVSICSRARRDDLALRVNLSAREFTRPELTETVRAALTRSGLRPDRLCLELTETTLMNVPDRALETLERLREIGVKFAIDDFGTGYSSLIYLKRFPVDAVKVDRSFITDVDHNQESRAIAESVLGLCATLGLEAVAEGVETEDQLRTLAELGYRRAQGFLVAGALSTDEFARLVGDDGR